MDIAQILCSIVDTSRSAGVQPREIRLCDMLYNEWIRAYGQYRALTTDRAVFNIQDTLPSGITVSRTSKGIAQKKTMIEVLE